MAWVWANKTSYPPPHPHSLLSVQSNQSEQLCICVLVVSIFTSFYPSHLQPVYSFQPYVLSTIYEWVIIWLRLDPISEYYVTLKVTSSAGQQIYNKVDMVFRRVRVNDSEQLCICVLVVSSFSSFYDCDIWFCNCSDGVVFFCFSRFL
jgi:hypothetical protein